MTPEEIRAALTPERIAYVKRYVGDVREVWTKANDTIMAVLAEILAICDDRTAIWLIW